MDSPSSGPDFPTCSPHISVARTCPAPAVGAGPAPRVVPVKRPTVRSDATTPRCEICSEATGRRRLRGGGVVDQCLNCGHVHRTLTDCPARHRSSAYGGDPSLDLVRMRLTYRALRGARRPSRVFEIGFGAGSLLRRFLDDGAEVAGIDARPLGAQAGP